VITLSEKDVKTLREKMLQSLEENLKLIKPSPSEVPYVYCMDLFRLGQGV